jgi:hypothetical protein
MANIFKMISDWRKKRLEDKIDILEDLSCDSSRPWSERHAYSYDSIFLKIEYEHKYGHKYQRKNNDRK